MATPTISSAQQVSHSIQPQKPSLSALEAAKLEDFSSIPETQRKRLEKDEVARVIGVLSLKDVQYKQTIEFREGPKEVSFPLDIHKLLYTIFCRVNSYGVLSGMSIKGSTNKHFLRDLPDAPFDIDCQIDVKEFRNVEDLDSLILSCFAEAGGITCDDTAGRRTYYQGRQKIVEVSPVPPKAPGFMRHRQCGRLLLNKNGLGNYCIVDEENRKFLLYTIHALHKGKPIKIDIHVVAKLDHQATCSMNSVRTAIHPLFLAQYKEGNCNLHDVPLWIKSVDDYPIDTALKHMDSGVFSYDPPISAASIWEGLHIHQRYLARGDTCLTKGVEKLLGEQFVRQYYEVLEEKGSKSVTRRLKARTLESNLKAELTEHFVDPKDRICFLLNLMDFHRQQGSPELEQLELVHFGLLLRELGETERTPEELRSFLHFCKVQAYFSEDQGLGKKGKKKLYMEFPFASALALFSQKKGVVGGNDKLLERLSAIFPIVGTDCLSFYEKSLSTFFSRSSAPGIAQLPPYQSNPLNNFQNFVRFYPVFEKLLPSEKIGEFLLFLLKSQGKTLLSCSAEELKRLGSILFSIFDNSKNEKLNQEIFRCLQVQLHSYSGSEENFLKLAGLSCDLIQYGLK